MTILIRSINSLVVNINSDTGDIPMRYKPSSRSTPLTVSVSNTATNLFWCCQNEKCNWDESCGGRPKEVPVTERHIYGKACPECGEAVFSQSYDMIV